ncbi:Receptor-like serine/threonine-protein kinase SD1-8 [Apostasia shenzhenica]|uniref:Receptor-like serine/threonine-protein kinase n=1 Tax=Apostasia shenzhenica TaxID=1088818 RepID=A0A2H9ZXD3_9ASPA|nr:Receptor-like serine/threonine-protein kinase SD1-8 [Apostasia shenzhenica]
MGRLNATFCLLFFIIFNKSSHFAASAALGDTLTAGQTLRDGDTLVSAAGTFALGFFTPYNSVGRRYVGIWYNNISVQNIVWVANRQNPVTSSGGTLTLVPSGTLLITEATSTVLWSAGSKSATNPVARLLDSGDFVVVSEDGEAGSYVWQSFDHPTDKLLPGMKLGWDFVAGLSRNLTAWAGPTDPSPGPYTLFIDPHGDPQLVLAANANWTWRAGPWNGIGFSGGAGETLAGITLGLNFTFISTAQEIYYTFNVYDSSVTSYVVASSAGVAARYAWIDSGTAKASGWNVYWEAPGEPCDFAGVCGAYGVCNPDDVPICSCLQGFTPSDPTSWALKAGSGGCKRRTELDCRNRTDGFVTVSGAKLPDTATATVDMGKGMEECREWCLKNCSCRAYARANISEGGRGCIVWAGDLEDLRIYGDAGQDLYVKVAAADLGSKKRHNYKVLKITSTVFAVTVLGTVIGICIWKQKRKQMQVRAFSDTKPYKIEREGKQEIVELHLYDMHILEAATDHFSIQNKLGEGGFGPVYKGKLDGLDIAVKRLAKTSTQGIDEFKNEVSLIAKLQHRNLVRLLGCCIEGDERMIVYEYMANKSLDAFLFDKNKRFLLDWPTRSRIIIGIVRGLLYLHQDSQFRIIHRDLKASNILLDNEMNPKISDFGMARIFGGDDTEINTRRVVGTYGYMSPEYAMDGVFSLKSDVFSFGVLMLEILSGRKNRGIYLVEHHSNLVGEAWVLWNEGKELEIIDDSIRTSISRVEALKCINLSLLCVQERAQDRPSMSSVFLMLCSDNTLLPNPTQPTFCATKCSHDEDYLTNRRYTSSDDITITKMEGR